VAFDEADNLVEAFAAQEVGEDIGAAFAHLLRVAFHDFEAGADMGREIGVGDDEEIGPRNGGPALAGDLFALRDRDHIDGEVREIGGEGRGEIVAAALDQDDVEIGEFAIEIVD
jgi:hypothetical protein